MKCDAVVLAAGFSSRMGAGKMSLAIDGDTVLGRVILTLRDFCGKIVVVGGHDFDSIRKTTDEYPDITLVKNQDYELGMFSSVKRGVSEMNGDFFLIPGDYPAVKKSTYETLLSGSADFIVPVFNERKGHPVLIREALIEKILAEPVGSNLKAFRDRCKVEYIEVDDRGILMDIDTKEDYQMVKEYIEKGES